MRGVKIRQLFLSQSLIPEAFRFRAAILKLENATHPLLRTAEELLVTEWSTGAAVCAEVPEFLFRNGTVTVSRPPPMGRN